MAGCKEGRNETLLFTETCQTKRSLLRTAVNIVTAPGDARYLQSHRERM